jgi:hypothetical protein
VLESFRRVEVDIVKLQGLAPNWLEVVFFDRLLEGLFAEVLGNLSARVCAELFLEEAGRNLARSEALHAYVFT